MAGGGAASPGQSSGVYAALDLGTNNCRLLIACPTGDGFRVIDSFSRIIRLGEGISATGRISDAAIGRAIAALEHLPRQDAGEKRHAAAADRDRSLPRGRQCRQFSRSGGGRDRHPARGDRPRDRGDACRDRLLAAARSARARRHPVRYRRRIDRTGADRTRPGTAQRRAAHQSLDVDPARRRHAGRAFRRQGRHAAILCADGAGGRDLHRAVRGRAWRRPQGHASARHLGHGDDAGRRPSQSRRATTAAGSTASG